MVFDLDDMPAEFALDRGFAILARGQSKGGIGELLDHVVMAEIPEIATRAGARIGRMFLGELGEIASLVELADDRLRFGLGLDQDMSGVNPFPSPLPLAQSLV